MILADFCILIRFHLHFSKQSKPNIKYITIQYSI